MKPKVLPGQTGATLDLLWISGFHPATCMWDLGEMWVEVVGVGTALCHTQCLASGRLPRGSSHLHHQEGAGSAETPCYCNPLQGLLQYPGSPMPSSHTGLLILYHRSRRGDDRCAARSGTPQCEYGARGPEEMLGELVLSKPLPMPWQLQPGPRGQWGHQAIASCLEGCRKLSGIGMCCLESLWVPMGGSRRLGVDGRAEL